jgi:hypothetical protein
MYYTYDKKLLQFKPISLTHYIYWIILAIFLFSSLSAGVSSKVTYDKIPVIIKYEETPFSEENLKKEITKLNLKFPRIVYSQCIVEGASKSGKRWSNPIFLNGNNFLGLKRAYYRPSTAVSWNSEGYCQYSSWKGCITDYALYQAQNLRRVDTEQEYIQFLKEMEYSVDTGYIKLINKIK